MISLRVWLKYGIVITRDIDKVLVGGLILVTEIVVGGGGVDEVEEGDVEEVSWTIEEEAMRIIIASQHMTTDHTVLICHRQRKYDPPVALAIVM